MRFAVHDFRIVLRPWLNRRELRVIADKRQPVRTRNHAKRALLQALRRDFEPLRVLALPYEHMHRSRSRLCNDRQARTADFLNPILQLLRRKSCGALRFVADDNFSARLAVFDEEIVCGAECRERCEQQGCGRENGSLHLGRSLLLGLMFYCPTFSMNDDMKSRRCRARGKFQPLGTLW